MILSKNCQPLYLLFLRHCFLLGTFYNSSFLNFAISNPFLQETKPASGLGEVLEGLWEFRFWVEPVACVLYGLSILYRLYLFLLTVESEKTVSFDIYVSVVPGLIISLSKFSFFCMIAVWSLSPMCSDLDAEYLDRVEDR